MPVQPTYPGVYIEEISSGVRTITGVATAITAFIGRAKKGPVNEPVDIFSFGDYERVFGGLWDKSTMSFAVRDFFLNGGGRACVVRVHNAATASEIAIATGEGAPDDTYTFVAVSPGSWGNNLAVQVDHNTKDPTNTSLFNLTVTEEGGITEKFFNMSVDPTSSSYIVQTLEQGSTLIRVKNTSPVLENRLPVLPAPIVVTSEGEDGNQITDQQIYSGANMETNKQGLYALEKADLFNLLCVPPYADTTGAAIEDLNETPTDVSVPLIAAAVTYCKKRRAMLLVDAHSSWNSMSTAKTSFTAAADAYPGTTSNFAALFFPRLKMANPLMKNQIQEFVPCGAVAGVMARTDAQRGVWKAPAGQDASIAGVSQFSVPLTDGENGVLNQLGINCLRSFPVYGRLIWGSRTLEGADQLASEWKYIPVRRTALFIEESLYRGTQWVVFEPNDESLWAQIRLNIGAFMHNLFRQGAFQGKTPREAYLVKCDKETTTQNDINNGIVNILVGFAPLKPAEFVIIKIQQLAGQIEI